MIVLLLAMVQAPPVPHATPHDAFGLTAQNFPPINHPGSSATLRQSVEKTCGIEAGLSRDALLSREFKLAAGIRGAKDPAAAWLRLGCIRGVLAGDQAPSREGPDMVAGNSWTQGAQRSMLEVLKLRPTDPVAAEILGLTALNGAEADDLNAAATTLAAAVSKGVMASAALRACSDLAMRRRDAVTARSCSMRALAAGIDSTWHLLRMSRLAFRDADTVNGAKWFVAAGAAARDTAARQEVDWHLQWFLTPNERTEWEATPPQQRRTWLRDRIASRDVRDGQPPGARLAEHFGRLEYVETHFMLDVAKRMHDALRTSPAVTELGGTPPNPDALILASLEPGNLSARMWREYDRWQVDFDDRGVVWMRFGQPLKRADWSCPAPDCPVVREAWLYEIDGRPMLLDFEDEGFDGSAQATRLVSGVLGSYLCDLDARRCNDNELSIATAWARASASRNKSDPHIMMLLPEEVEAIRQQDREYISVATTTDDNSPRGERNVELVSRLHRLWDPVTAAPIALVTYALPIKDLSIQAGAGTRTTLVDLELRQWDAASDAWRDTTFTRRFTLPDTSVKRPALTGFMVVPSSPGVSSWSLVATQPGHRRGRSFDVTTPGLRDGAATISDLVLGSEVQGLTWNLHNVPIPLAPVNSVDRNTTVALYYQVKSATAHTDLRTTVAIYRRNTNDTTPALEVSYDQALQAGVNEVAPTLDVSRLDKGAYSLEVRLTDAKGTVITRRRADLVLE